MPDTVNPQTVIDGLLARHSALQFLSKFRDLYACCKWGKTKGLIKVNPFAWLEYQLCPIYRDLRYMENVKSQINNLDCVKWFNLADAPNGQEMQRLRIAAGSEVVDDYAATNVEPLWFKCGEAPVLLMLQNGGYRAIRKTVLHPTECVKPVIRQVIFDESYVAALKQQQGKTWEEPSSKRQATMPLSTLTALATATRLR